MNVLIIYPDDNGLRITTPAWMNVNLNSGSNIATLMSDSTNRTLYLELCGAEPFLRSWEIRCQDRNKRSFCTRMYPKVSGLAAWSENWKC